MTDHTQLDTNTILKGPQGNHWTITSMTNKTITLQAAWTPLKRTLEISHEEQQQAAAWNPVIV